MQNRRPATAASKHNSQKRRPVIHVLPDEVALRVVCHASVVGGVIGSSGAVVSQLRRETGTKIHCEAPVDGSEHWIVLIVGSSAIDKRVVLTDRVGDCIGGSEEGERVECKASAAQAALIRVLERVWTVLAEKEGGGGGEEEAYCGLLADRSQIGAVLGKRGKNVEWMRGETGAKIRILPPPSCGSKGDELIQITGGALAVKKALIMVSGCLQDCPPIDGHPPPCFSIAFEKFIDGNPKDPHSEFFPHLSSFLPAVTGDNAVEVASGGPSSSTDAEGNSNTDAKDAEQEVVFRMICTNVAAGGIIGKKGATIRALQNETGASIVVGAPSMVSGERVVTVSAYENLESWYSPAQNALVLVFARSAEIDIERGLLPGLREDAVVKAKLLVPSDFVNCLIENRGVMLSEMIEVSGADIQVPEREEVLDCISENEAVMEIVGEYKNVQNALFQVTARLRDNLLPSEVLSEVRAGSPYESAEASYPGLYQLSSISPDSSQDSNQAQKMESSISGNAGASCTPNLQPSQIVSRSDSLSGSDGEEDLKMVGSSTELEKLLGCLLPAEVLNEVGQRNINGEFKDAYQENDMRQGPNRLGLSSNGQAPSSSNLCPSRKKSFSVRNITLEIAVSEDTLVTLCGRYGSSLNNLQQAQKCILDMLKSRVNYGQLGYNRKVVKPQYVFDI